MEKMSEMIFEFASDFINIGDTVESKQCYLNAACNAWNIAVLPKHKRNLALNQYLKLFKIYNPECNDVSGIRHDMEILIRRKLEVFPKIKKRIFDAKIVENEGKHSIVACSIREDP